MQPKNKVSITRRTIMYGLASTAIFAPTILRAETSAPVRRNTSSFRTHRWEDHFETLGVGLILSDTASKVLQHWTQDGEMRLYPTSVPLSEDLTRLGYTEVVEKRKNPNWAPTPSMRERNPEWPARILGGDPANPLGTRALYLSCLLYTSPSPRDRQKSRMPSSA